MRRPKHVLLFLLVVSLLGALPLAQNREKIKLLFPTHKGSSGLFNLSVADTLRPGEFVIGAYAHKYNRDPGDLDYTVFPLSFTVGLHRRVELFASMEAYKRVNADDIVVNKVLPNGPLVPAVLNNNRPGGIVGFYNDSPYMDVGFGDGTGDLWTGLKWSLMSERFGDPVGFAIQPVVRLHLTNDRQHLLRGLTSGATDYGFDVIVSKHVGRGGTLAVNAGMLQAGDLKEVDRQNSFNYGVGMEYPLAYKKVNVVGEIVGRQFYGDKTSASVNNKSPIDAYLGLRTFPSKWMTFTGAANYHMTGTHVSGVSDADCLGFYFQAAFKRVINEPPTVECSTTRSTITEGDSTAINISYFDPDDDTLAVTWKASGGRLSQGDQSATLDTTGLAPGRYSVMAEVGDGDNVASCSSDITVEKRKLAPTIVCEPRTSSLTMGDSVTLTARASDPNGDPLTYAWTVNGQAVTNNRPAFEFGSAGRTAGSYTARVTATDVDNMSASCEFTVSVNLRPNNNPTCSLRLSPATVMAGEMVTATGSASDPDNDPLTYAWQVDGQSRPGSGSTLQINTSGMTGGSHSVTLRVTDDRGGSCTSTQSFAVSEKIVIPMSGFRPDNKAKARLDEIALKMQQTPQLRARVTGHTDSVGSEESNVRAGQRRADAVKDYLVTQHNIDASRIEATSAGEGSPIADNSTADGRTQNRRVEIELFVP